MRFKTEIIKKEWKKLAEKNPFLYQLLKDIEDYSIDQFNLVPVVTCIYRSQEETKRIYGRYKPSVHEFWRGVDIRSWIYTDEQLEQLVNFIKDNYEYDPKRPNKNIVIVHNVGKGKHVHIQSHPRSVKKNV